MRYLRAMVVYTWAFLVLCTRWPLLRSVERQRETDFLSAMKRIHGVASGFAQSICRLAGCQIDVRGVENIPQDGSVVLIGNHQSFFDIPILLATVQRPLGFFGQTGIERGPLVWPLDRRHRFHFYSAGRNTEKPGGHFSGSEDAETGGPCIGRFP